jgi:hypothetical protein
MEARAEQLRQTRRIVRDEKAIAGTSGDGFRPHHGVIWPTTVRTSGSINRTLSLALM